MAPESSAAPAEEVSALILPAHDYLSTRLPVSRRVHKGLDRIAYSFAGRYRRRSSILCALLSKAEQIVDNSLKLRHLAEDDLRKRMSQLRLSYRRQGRGYENSLPEALTIISEISDRTLGLRPYPIQIMGAMALHKGYLAEMATGEGKSLTACLAAIPAVWTDRPCHVITANDYLAGRDADEMRPLYSFCGLSAGWVNSTMETGERRMNYEKGVVYTTSKELLADFLRDRLKMRLCHQPSQRLIRHIIQPGLREREGLVMRGLDAVIVDEADSLLIDEAVTPLIISRPHDDERLLEACQIAHGIAETLAASVDYSTNLKHRDITLTKRGREKIEALATSLPDFWRVSVRREELVMQALVAKEFYQRDKDYVIQNDKVVIVDEFTGRLMPNRTWNHGLHQAVEVREGLELSDPGETIARLSFQRFFRLFRKLSGMTGTASDAAEEFWQIYGLSILTIPTHRPCIRKQLPDRVFPDQASKWKAITEDVVRWHLTGRPVLIGTRSVAASERLASMLAVKGLTFNLLNAVRHREEAAIIAKAGENGAVTIATNMAGRGTDIKLGRGVADLDGLHVIATERHESRRIDRQLFGRCARQGDPGSVQTFMSMEDELIERFVPAPVRRLISSTVKRQSRGMQRIAEQCFSYAQNTAQRVAFRQRRYVLQMDTWLAEALSFAGSEAGE